MLASQLMVIGEVGDPTLWEDDTLTDANLDTEIEYIPCFTH